jgi:phosphoesterase RecJ-like protein
MQLSQIQIDFYSKSVSVISFLINMSQLLYKKILEKITLTQRILLVTDDKIDGDTIGSTLGMAYILRDLGKDVRIFSPKPLLESLEFLPGKDGICRNIEDLKDFDVELVMIFDASEGLHLWPILDELNTRVPIVVFDHHAFNPNYGDFNIVEVEASSTGDVVWRFVKWAGFEVSREAAQCFLTAICTDTNVFHTSNTTTACLQAAHELTVLGAKLQIIVKETMLNRSPQILKLWGRAFERLHLNQEFEALTTVILKEDLLEFGVDDVQASELSEFLNAMVIDFESVVVLREADGGVKGSLRSHSRDVKKVAERYGGGGHRLASGFFVKESFLVEKDGQWRIERLASVSGKKGE